MVNAIIYKILMYLNTYKYWIVRLIYSIEKFSDNQVTDSNKDYPFVIVEACVPRHYFPQTRISLRCRIT